MFSNDTPPASQTIIPIKQSDSSRDETVDEGGNENSNSSTDDSVEHSVSNTQSSSSKSSVATYHPSSSAGGLQPIPNITRSEVLDLIQQSKDNNQSLLNSLITAAEEKSLSLNQSVSSLERKISAIQSNTQRQLDKPGSTVSRTDADIQSVTNASIIGATITTSSFSGTTGDFSGNATISGTLTAGTSTLTSLTVTSTTATSTFSGKLVSNFAPTLAHTFGSWSTGVSGANPLGASLIINPSSAAADSNLLSLSVNGSAKFLVDAEGDIFANAITVVGGTTLSTTTASTFTVENNTFLGDATTTDTTYFNSRIADSLIPTADNLLDLGDSTNWLRWRTGYFGTSVGVGGTATSTGLQLTTSGAYLIDSNNTLSINTTNNKAVSFGNGNISIPYASSTALTVSGSTYLTGLGQGWIHTTGGVNALSASTSPTVNYITATSTTATSTFPYLSVTTNSNVGTVVGGTWQGTAVGAQYGGTGQNFSASSGLVNFYSGAASTIATSSLGLLTTNVAKGTNLYWTNDRFDTRLSATTTLPNLTTLLGLTNATTTGITSTNSWLGTIRSGTWNGTAISNQYGGTGLDSSALTGIAQIVAGTWSASSTLSAAYGGTGWNSIQANSILLGNGAGKLATTSAGTDGYVLALSAGVPTWLATSTLSTITGTLTVAKGGTGLTAYTAGDVLYASGTGTLAGTSTANLKTTLALNNVENTALSTWAGSSNITTLGTITAGTWSGASIANTKGGTGLDSSALTGIAQIVAGTWSASSTLSAAYGGTGWNSIAAGYALFGNGAGALATSSSFYWDNTNSRLGIGTTSPSVTLHLNATGSNPSQIYLDSSATGYNNIMFREAGSLTSFIQHVNSNYTAEAARNLMQLDNRAIGGAIVFYIGAIEKCDWQITATSASGRLRPGAKLHTLATTEQLRLGFDFDSYASLTIDTNGDLKIDPTGTVVTIPDQNLKVCAGDACQTTALNSGNGNLTVENNIEIGGAYNRTCPTGYVWAPGSAKFGTLPGFCVMKYEAKNDGANNVSVNPTHAPYVSIDQPTSRSKCEAIGLGYHLISEPEWMTIAENIAQTPINDLDDDAGLQLATGHSDNGPASALAATDGANPVVSGCNLSATMENAANAYSASSCEIRGTGAGGSTDNDKGYYGTGQIWSATGYSSGLANKAQLRTHILSNGNVIWDIAGNVWEWTDAYVNGTVEKPTPVTDAWQEWTAVTNYLGLNYARPQNTAWNSANGIGQYYSGTVAGQRGFVRGGDWGSGARDGVFTLNLYYAPSLVDTGIGFRCSR